MAGTKASYMARRRALNKQAAEQRQEEQPFVYKMTEGLKAWSDTEEKHATDTTKKIYDYLSGDKEGFYEEVPDDEPIFSETLERDSNYKANEYTVHKSHIAYSSNWDENDNRVKQGKAVSGTTYYLAQDENGAIDEAHFAYKTKEEAIHAVKLAIDREKQVRQYWANRRK